MARSPICGRPVAAVRHRLAALRGLIPGLLGAGLVLATTHADAAALQSFFKDSFESNPLPTQRILLRPVFTPNARGTARHDETAHAFVLEGHLSAFRTIPASCDALVRFHFQYQPQPADEQGPDLTELGFDLPDRSRITVQWRHAGPRAERTMVRIVMPGAATTLREAPCDPALQPAEWIVRYRHGWVEVQTGGRPVISADLGRLGVAVHAVSIAESGGILRCFGLEASGVPVPEQDDEARRRLKEASSLNDEGSRLLNAGELAGALVKTTEASELFLRVLGEEHPDTANSWANRATVSDRMGRREEASRLWQNALAAHERTLGTNHPHTTLTRFGWGKHLLDTGQTRRAWQAWWQCREAWTAVQGSNSPIVLSLEKAYLAAGSPPIP